jgi:transposase-like protein
MKTTLSDLDTIRARAFVKGGPEGAASAGHAVEDRNDLLVLLDEAEDAAKAQETEMKELKDSLKSAEAQIRRAQRLIKQVAEILDGQ